METTENQNQEMNIEHFFVYPAVQFDCRKLTYRFGNREPDEILLKYSISSPICLMPCKEVNDIKLRNTFNKPVNTFFSFISLEHDIDTGLFLTLLLDSFERRFCWYFRSVATTNNRLKFTFLCKYLTMWFVWMQSRNCFFLSDVIHICHKSHEMCDN